MSSKSFAAENLPGLLLLVRDGKLNVKKLIDREVSLEEGAQALMDMDKKSPTGMIMVTRFGETSCRL